MEHLVSLFYEISPDCNRKSYFELVHYNNFDLLKLLKSQQTVYLCKDYLTCSLVSLCIEQCTDLQLANISQVCSIT